MPCKKCSRIRFDALRAIRYPATKAVADEIRKGKLPSLSLNVVVCVDCGRRAQDYDHRDYSRPLDVQPVCRKCNLKRGHAKQAAEYAAEFPVYTCRCEAA